MSYCIVCTQPFVPLPLRGIRNGFAFRSCQACGTIFTDPFPTLDQLRHFYNSGDFSIEHIAHPEGAILQADRLIKKVTEGQYTSRRFLDVTARRGYSVVAAKMLGMQARGADTLRFFVDFARRHYGAELFEHEPAAALAAREEQAELVFSIEGFVSEPDPNIYAASLSRLVAPGGKLYIEEPNGNSFWLPRDLTRWSYANPPVNFIYISFKGMRQLLDRHGLRIERTFFSWGPFMRIVAVRKSLSV